MAVATIDSLGGVETLVLSGFTVVLFTIAAHSLWRQSQLRKTTENVFPPLYSGWLPWVGCAVEFGREPVYFIEEKRKELGPVFTLLVAGERMTFLTEAEDFHVFFQSDSVDFQMAVQSAVQRVASVSHESFFLYHTKIHDTVKGKLAATRLPALFSALQQEFAKGLDEISTPAEYELHALVRNVMYRGVIENLFGKGTLPVNDQEKYKMLEKHFVKFDDQFEYGSKLPPSLLREWSKSKAWLLDLFQGVVQQLKTNRPSGAEDSVLQSLLQLVDAQHAANYSLLLLWASLANAIPIMFWTLAFMLANPQIVRRAREEVDAVLGTSAEVKEEHLAGMPYLKCCVLEAIRLRCPGIIARRVVKPFTVKNYTVPSGDLLMISPFWAHRNSSLFPDPDRYLPERWQSAELEKNLFLPGFIAFGGGRYQCPGRWFALLELHMFLAQFLQRFHCQLLGPVPDLSPLHLVGTQQPVGPCQVRVTRRENK